MIAILVVCFLILFFGAMGVVAYTRQPAPDAPNTPNAPVPNIPAPNTPNAPVPNIPAPNTPANMGPRGGIDDNWKPPIDTPTVSSALTNYTPYGKKDPRMPQESDLAQHLMYGIAAPGYEYTGNIGSYSYLIDPVKQSMEKMADLCDKTPNCVGFTTDGWLKWASPVPTNMPNSDTTTTYLKNNKMSTLDNGFTFVPGQIYRGNNLYSVGGARVGAMYIPRIMRPAMPIESPYEMMKKCKSDITCRAFDSTGMYKGGIPDTMDATGRYVNLSMADNPTYGTWVKR